MGTAPFGEETAAERIAIIGMAGRFPGAPDIDALWENLIEGAESLTELSDEQLRAAGVSEESIASPYYIRTRPLLEDVEGFDAGYFGRHPREADIADPQQRIFVEVCHTALQHAGYDTSRSPEAIGVFGGSSPPAYHFWNVYENDRVRTAVGDMAVEINNSLDYLATHVAHALGLKGPAISLVTACSTSLVAVHSACRSLTAGECRMAVAGGVSVLIPHHAGQMWAENSIYARDGHVRPFDADAAGTNFGNGAGAVVLKRYEDAVADGDHIEAVVLATATNNDGARRNGFTAPSEEGQTEVIKQALQAVGGLSPDTIGYVEAHGTGTAVGDPIEVAALTAAYREAGATGVQSCSLGSVKANIGHLGPAAGIAGLIRTVLSMRRGVIPPLANLRTPNPRIGFQETPFSVNREPVSWPEGAGPKRAGISSFGIGGTNAHLILEEAPVPQPSAVSEERLTDEPQVLPLSARSESALAALRTELAAHLRAQPQLALADVAHTLQSGRRELRYRTAVVCGSTPGAAAALERPQATPVESRKQAGAVFLFPGQGSQWPGMVGELHARESRFRRTVDECCALLHEELGLDLRTLICELPSGEAAAAEAVQRLQRTGLAQPALFVTEYALARLWIDRGVRPSAMIGHSIGEYAAACVAGVFTLPEALRLVAVRGRLTQEQPPGAMLAVLMGEKDLAPLLPDELSLAAVNGPKNCTVSGPEHELGVLADWLSSVGVRTRYLRTSHAFHSAMLDPVVEPLKEAVAEARPQPPQMPIISSLTGTWITDEQAMDPGYWGSQLRETVRFGEACQTAAETGATLLETGPGQSLTALARSALGRGAAVVPSLRRPESERTDAECLAEAVGMLWTHGVPVDWAELRNGAPRRRLALPTYPYERTRHWVEPDEETEQPAAAQKPVQLDAADSTFLPVWRRRPAAPPSAALEADGGSWLVLGGTDGLAEAVARRLEGLGARVIRVTEGTGFAEVGDSVFTLRPSRRSDYDVLLSTLEAGPGLPAHILHGWSDAPAPGSPLDRAEIDHARDSGFHSMLCLSQALLERAPAHQVDIRVLTTRSCDVSGADPVEPAKALLQGPCRVVPHEATAISCQLIDAGPDASADPVAVEQLTEEVTAALTDPFVAYRAGRRWVAEHEQVALPAHTELPRTLRRRGVYLITGGFGGIGLETAKELARTAAARLVLVSRSPLPPRENWDAHLAEYGPQDRVSRRIQGAREVEELGGEVLVATADVADEPAMRKVIDDTAEHFGRIHGVFHAAGVPGGGLAALRSAEQVAEVLAPKVEGTLVLDRLFGAELELLVLFSSIVSVSGDYGMVDYCSANAFLDAYAHFRRAAAGCRTVAVNWCGWTEVGMIGETAAAAPRVFRELEQGVTHTPAAHPLLDRRQADTENGEVVFSTLAQPGFHWIADDHLMGGSPVFPGTACIEMMLAAYREGVREEPVVLSEVLFSRPLDLDRQREVQVRGLPRKAGGYEFIVRSRVADRPESSWSHHARAIVAPAGDSTSAIRYDLAELKKRCDEYQWSPSGFDGHLVSFGAHWPVVELFRIGRGEHLVQLRLPEGQDTDLGDFVLHPSLLDGANALSMFLPDRLQDGDSFLPVGYGRILVHEPLPAVLYSYVRPAASAVQEDASEAAFDIAVLDAEGRELVTVEAFTVRILRSTEMRDPGQADVGPAALGAQPGPSPGSPAGRGPEPAERTGSEGELLITPGEGLSLMWRILDARTEPQYIVSKEPLAERSRRIARMAVAIDNAASKDLMSDAAVSGERSASAVPESATDIEAKLAGLWQEAFGIPQIPLDEDFFDIGGNSLVAVQLAVRIRESFGVSMPGVAILEYPTIRELAQRVDEALAEETGES